MYCHQNKLNVLAVSFISVVLFLGCGDGGLSSGQNESLQMSQKNLRASTYISKGNFIEVASFAYKRVTNPSFTKEMMDVSLPGNELVQPSTYSIRAITSQERLKKIVVQNHLNRLEIKPIDNGKVNILLQGTNFTIDRKMALTDFIAEY